VSLFNLSYEDRVDLELTKDPAPPRGIFLYLMVCSIQKKMIAKLCWGFKELRAFKIPYHLKNCHLFVYLTIKHTLTNYFHTKQNIN